MRTVDADSSPFFRPRRRSRYCVRVASDHLNSEGGAVLKISARNQLPEKIIRIQPGSVMAEVVVQVGGQEIVSEITLGSVQGMGLKVGDQVWAIVKATDVMIAVKD